LHHHAQPHFHTALLLIPLRKPGCRQFFSLVLSLFFTEVGMTRQLSFKAQQREVEPHFRSQIDAAESTEDVKKFYERTIFDFLNKAIGDQVEIEPGDVVLDPEEKQGYQVSQRLRDDDGFNRLHEESDLPAIMLLLTERALNRHKHLVTKQPDKTEIKIFQVPGPRRN
jgi:hypothetical protein